MLEIVMILSAMGIGFVWLFIKGADEEEEI
jgi:hypothetical protein